MAHGGGALLVPTQPPRSVVSVDAGSHQHSGSRPRYADADTSFEALPAGGSVKDLDKNIVVGIEELVLSPSAGGSGDGVGTEQLLAL